MARLGRIVLVWCVVIGLLAACSSEDATPTPTPTRAAPRATWTPLLTSTIEVAPIETAPAVSPGQLVVTTNANLRAGPGTDFARVGSAKAGDRLEVAGRNADGTWFALASGAWIFGELVTGDSGDLPVIEAAVRAPAPPTVAVRAAPANCSPCYPGVCIPPGPPDLDCKQITERQFLVAGCDEHQFDLDFDGVGCELE